MTVQLTGRYRVRLSRGDIAWLILFSGVVAYDLTAKDGDLLSEAVDGYLLSRPWLTRAVIAVTALHLANCSPRWVDPYHLAFHAHRAWARQRAVRSSRSRVR